MHLHSIKYQFARLIAIAFPVRRLLKLANEQKLLTKRMEGSAGEGGGARGAFGLPVPVSTVMQFWERLA